jgi:uncharacterized protein
MRRFWIWLADRVSRRTAVVLAAAALVTVVLALGLGQLGFATGQDSYLDPDSKIAIDNREYQDLFGGQAMVVLLTADEGGSALDLFEPENRERMGQLEADLRAIDGVVGVVSPLTALEWSDNLVEGGLESRASQILQRAIARETDEAAAAARLESGSIQLARGAEIPDEERTFENRAWLEFLLFDNTGFSLGPDGELVEPPPGQRQVRAALRPVFTFAPGTEPIADNANNAQVVVRLAGNASLDEEGAATDAVLAVTQQAEFQGFSTLTTGAPVLLKDINDYLQGGMLTLGGIAVIVMFFALLIAFRARWRFLPLGIVLTGIIWTFGLLGYVGFELSLVTISGLPILIGMGIDYAIQIHNRIEEEVVLDKDLSPFATTSVNLGPPLVISVIAAIVAFMALRISAVPMIQDFAVLLSVGIFIILVGDVLLTLSVLRMRERRSPTPVEGLRPQPGQRRGNVVARTVVTFGRLPQWTVGPLIVLAVALFGFGILAEDAFEIQTDPERWANQDTRTIRELDELRAETGSSSELGYFVQAPDGVFDDEVAGFMADFGVGQIDEHPDELITVSGLATTVFYLMETPGASALPPTGEDLRLAYEAAPPDVQRSVLNEEGTAANLIYRVGNISLEERRDLIIEMDAAADAPPGSEITASGLGVVGVGLLDNLQRNRAQLTYFAFGFVALWLAIRFLSIPKMLLTLVPVAMAVGTSSLVIAAAGFKLSPMTTISGPLVIANCAEFCVLIMGRYLEERRSGFSPAESGDRAAARTGQAFVTSALTTIGGFGVLIFSALPLLRDFGIIVTLNVAVALLSALVVLPPLMMWADRRKFINTTRDLPGE